MRTLFVLIIALVSFLSVDAQQRVVVRNNFGAIEETGTLVLGEKHGVWSTYTKDTILVKEELFDKGQVVRLTTYNRNGTQKKDTDTRVAPWMIRVTDYDSEGRRVRRYHGQGRGVRTNISDHLGYSMSWHKNSEALKSVGCYFSIEEKRQFRPRSTYKPRYFSNRFTISSHSFNKVGKCIGAGGARNSIAWHPNGVLSRWNGPVEPLGFSYNLRFNKSGQRVDHNGYPLKDQSVIVDPKKFKNLVEGEMVDGMPHGTWKNYYPNGQLWYIMEYDKGVPVGKYESWYMNGEKCLVAHLKDGFFHGLMQSWFPHGQMDTEGRWTQGRQDGEWKFWDEDGELVLENIYDNGKKVITSFSYAPSSGNISINKCYDADHNTQICEGTANGMLVWRAHTDSLGQKLRGQKFHSNGQLEKEDYERFGLYRTYHANGQLARIGSHSADVYTLGGDWDEKGNLTSAGYRYSNEAYASVQFYPDTFKARYVLDKKEHTLEELPWYFLLDRDWKLKEEVTYDKTGLRHGICKTYYPTGQVWEEAHYDHGKFNGTYKMWSVHGRLVVEGHFVQDIKHGRFATWKHDGKPLTEEYFKNGVRDSVWKKWYEKEDQLTYYTEYKNGMMHGRKDMWDIDGSKVYEELYRDDKKHGACVYYHHKDGWKKGVENYVEGVREGRNVRYDSRGDSTWVGTYISDKRHGLFKSYEDGKVIQTKYYHYGEQADRPVGLACHCDNKSVRWSRGPFYDSDLRKVFSYLDLERYNIGLQIDSAEYERLRVSTTMSYVYNDGSGLLEVFDLFSYRSLNVRLDAMPGLQFDLGRCKHGNIFSVAPVSIKYKEVDGKITVIDATLEQGEIAVTFPTQLLRQWDARTNSAYMEGSKNFGAQLMLEIEKLKFTEKDELYFEKSNILCFSEAEIGGTNTTIAFDSAQFHLKPMKVIQTPFYQEHGGESTTGIWVPTATGTMLLNSNQTAITYQNILLRGDLVLGTIDLSKATDRKQVIKAAESRFSATAVDGDKLYFVYKP